MNIRSRSATATAETIVPLPDNEIHVWSVCLKSSERELADLIALLSLEERERADRFKGLPARNAYIMCRGMLRVMLSRYTGGDPRTFLIEYGPWGKPHLSSEAVRSIHFNVSHSHEIGVIALSRCRALGVDVEHVRPLSDAGEIAERHFSQDEYDQFKDLPEQRRTEGFLRLWTRKEAVAKATGEGLSLPMKQFSVSPVPGSAEAVAIVALDSRQASTLRLVDLPKTFCAGPEAYVGAIAAEGHDWQMKWQGCSRS